MAGTAVAAPTEFLRGETLLPWDRFGKGQEGQRKPLENCCLVSAGRPAAGRRGDIPREPRRQRWWRARWPAAPGDRFHVIARRIHAGAALSVHVELVDPPMSRRHPREYPQVSGEFLDVRAVCSRGPARFLEI